MHRVRLVLAFFVIALLGITLVAQQKTASNAGRLTIEKLIDIKHPSNPVWSHDSKKVAFVWERAGVSDLYVVPADGSSKPIALTSGGGAPNAFTWSADNRSIYFNSGGTMMQISVTGGTPQ